MPSLRDIQIRDPFILRAKGSYYLFGSTDKDIWKSPGAGFDVYRSRDSLTEFEGPFPAFRPPAGFWATYNFWAPEVYAYGKGYYMFATFLPDDGHRGTTVLFAEDPAGPYRPWSSEPVTPADWDCLDGTLYVDGSGSPWMVFCHEWQQVGDGQICALPLRTDLKEPAGPARLLFRASEAPWAKPLAGRAPGSYVTDGPFLYKARNGTLLMLWSSFGADDNYCVGAAASSGGRIDGPWIQNESPLYAADGGHGMLFKAGDGKLYLAIHTPNQTPDERAVFVEVRERGGGLSMTGRVIS